MRSPPSSHEPVPVAGHLQARRQEPQQSSLTTTSSSSLVGSKPTSSTNIAICTEGKRSVMCQRDGREHARSSVVALPRCRDLETVGRPRLLGSSAAPIGLNQSGKCIVMALIQRFVCETISYHFWRTVTAQPCDATLALGSNRMVPVIVLPVLSDLPTRPRPTKEQTAAEADGTHLLFLLWVWRASR